MVAWRLILSTPEYPAGRELILIANDLTYLIGSFGPKEDILFNKASILARELKVPRVSVNFENCFYLNHFAILDLLNYVHVSYRFIFRVTVVHVLVWLKK